MTRHLPFDPNQVPPGSEVTEARSNRVLSMVELKALAKGNDAAVVELGCPQCRDTRLHAKIDMSLGHLILQCSECHQGNVFILIAPSNPGIL